MSTDEPMIRLQNALATLAELGANHERRISRVEEAYVTLVELTQRHSDTADELRTAQAESEHKIAALVDAQIRTEESHSRSMVELRAAQAEAAQKIGELADAMAGLTERVDTVVRNEGGRDQN